MAAHRTRTMNPGGGGDDCGEPDTGHSSVGSIGLSPIGQGQKGPMPQRIFLFEKSLK